MQNLPISDSVKNSALVILALGAIMIEVIDKSLSGSQLLGSDPSNHETIVFGGVALLAMVTQLLLIRFATGMITGGKSPIANVVLRTSVILQYSLIGLLVAVFLETLLLNEFQIVLVELVIGVSLVTSGMILIILALKFISTIRFRVSKIVVAYMIATVILSLSTFIMFIYVEIYLQRRPEVITQYYNVWTSYGAIAPDSLVFFYQILGILSFLAFWVATLLLTMKHISLVKNLRYWAIICIPILYFLSQYLIVYLEEIDPVKQFSIENTSIYSYLYNLFLNTIGIIGGICFGIPFFMIARSTGHVQLKRSIMMTGLGLIVLTGANAASIVVMTNYPPWGVISFSFSIAGSFCLIIGLDTAALYIASDNSLRWVLRKSPKDSYDIFDTLGFTKAQDIVTERINEITQRVYEEIQHDNMFRSMSEPQDVKGYIDEVLQELKRNTDKSDDVERSS